MVFGKGSIWQLTICGLYLFYRDVDQFIGYLKSTIAFLTGLENGEGAEGEDDFVPFI
jgi:hypothetical protein